MDNSSRSHKQKKKINGKLEILERWMGGKPI